MEGGKKKKKVSGLNGKKKRKSRNPILAEREKAREDEAAAKIQAIQRGRVAREKVEELKEEKEEQERRERNIEWEKEQERQREKERIYADMEIARLRREEEEQTKKSENTDKPKEGELINADIEPDRLRKVNEEHKEKTDSPGELTPKAGTGRQDDASLDGDARLVEEESSPPSYHVKIEVPTEKEQSYEDWGEKGGTPSTTVLVQNSLLSSDKKVSENVQTSSREAESRSSTPEGVPPPPSSPTQTLKPRLHKRGERPRKTEATFLAAELKNEIKNSASELDKAKLALKRARDERLVKEEAFRVLGNNNGLEEELQLAREELNKVQEELTQEREMRATLSQTVEDLTEQLHESLERQKRAESVVLQVDEAVKAKNAEIRDLERKVEASKKLVKTAREDAKLEAQLEIERLKTELEMRTQLLNMRWQRHEQMMRESYESHRLKPSQSLPELPGMFTNKPSKEPMLTFVPPPHHHNYESTAGIDQHYPPGMAPPNVVLPNYSKYEHEEIMSNMSPQQHQGLPSVHTNGGNQEQLKHSPSADSVAHVERSSPPMSQVSSTLANPVKRATKRSSGSSYSAIHARQQSRSHGTSARRGMTRR